MDPLTPEEERAEAEALLLLLRVPGLGEVGVKRLVTGLGSGRAALVAPGRALAEALHADGARALPIRSADLARARAAPADRRAVAAMLAAAERAGLAVVPIGGALYPARLLELDDPPPVLFLRGRSELLGGTCAAVIGARRATGYGRRVAYRMGAGLARAGAVVVSGLALGVDAEAHRGALQAGGLTVAVLGGGVDRVHPPSHARLHRAIGERGLLVSEFPPGTLPLPHHFPKRNRIMAALARAVVVVEAAMRSGALITVRRALDLGREVLAIPGPIDAPTSAGSNALLRDGGTPAFGVDDVLSALELEPAGPAVADTPAPGTDGAALWDALDGAPRAVDELAGRAGLSLARSLAALSLLELEGRAVRTPGGRFARSGA